MKRKTKVLLILALVLIIAFFSARYYIYHAGKRDIQSETTAFTVAAKNITEEFTTNAESANKKYLNKPVAVSGIITSVNATEVIIDNTVNCNFIKTKMSITDGQNITIKGRVIGFDDLLGEVKMDQCTISTNK